MMPPEAKSVTVQALLNSVSAANTTQATGGWVDVRGTAGDIVVIQNVGAVTGSITGALETADTAGGGNNVAMTFDDGNNFTAVSSPNNVQIKNVDANKHKGWIKYIGTVATGPALVGVTVVRRPKESS